MPKHRGPTDPDLDPLVAVVLSHLIGSCQSRAAAFDHTVRAVADYGRTPLPVGAGGLDAAPFPDLPNGPWGDGRTTLKRLGTDMSAIRETYARRRLENGPWARLDQDLLLALFPRMLWPVVRRMAEDGPEVFARRAEQALATYALTSVPENKRRPSGPPARATIRSKRGRFKRLADTFVALRDLGCHPAELGAWTRAPRLEVRREWGSAGIQVRAPRLEAVRVAWRTLDADLRRRLGAEPGEPLLEAVERLTDNQVHVNGLHNPFRRLLVLELLVLTGARLDALLSLNKSDYVRETVGPAPDHRRGAVLRLRPGKTLPLDVVRPKPIPPETADLIEAWLRYLARRHSVTYRLPPVYMCGRPGSPEMPGDHPLLVGRPAELTRWEVSSMRCVVSGQPPTKRKKASQKALVPRDGGWPAHLSSEHRPCCGYTPHEYRHLAQQLAEQAAALWNREHPGRSGRAEHEPALYASALLDHDPPGSAMRNVYGDRRSDELYEVLAGRATANMYRLLTGPEGARRRPSRTEMQRAADKLALVEAEISRVHVRAEALRCDGHQDELATALTAQSGLVDDTDRGLILAVRDGQHMATAEVLNRLERLREENRAQHRITYEIQTLHALREELKNDVRALWSDESRWEVVPDDAPPGAEQIDFTLEQILGGTLEHATAAPGQVVDAPLRDWLLPVELAGLLEVDRTTVLRYLSGDQRPMYRGTLLWEPDRPPVDESLGRNFRRIWVPGIADAVWRTATMRGELDRLLSEWPAFQGWRKDDEPTARSLAPLAINCASVPLLGRAA